MSIRWCGNRRQLDRVISEIENEPGIVLFTLVERELSEHLRQACEEMGCPSMSVLDPIVGCFSPISAWQ